MVQCSRSHGPVAFVMCALVPVRGEDYGSITKLVLLDLGALLVISLTPSLP